MDKIILMLKLMYRCMKTYRRISKLQKIQFKLLDEMNVQLKQYEKDKDLYVGTQLFQSNEYVSQYIKTLEKNIDIMDNKMKELLNN